MKSLGVFDFVSVDGFFAGPHGEIDWFKAISHDEEYERFMHQQSKSESTLIFGRTTYEMMKSFWPTPDAIKSDPAMAKSVNHSPKLVFSKTLKSVEEGPDWKSITLSADIKSEKIKQMKAEKGDGFTILGSGSIIQQFANL